VLGMVVLRGRSRPFVNNRDIWAIARRQRPVVRGRQRESAQNRS